MDLSKLLFSLGTAYWNSSKHDLSIPVFTKAMEIDHTDYGRIFQVLSLYAEQARSFAKDLVKQALDVLSDDDEDSDLFAYISLPLVFIPLEDDANALATLSLLARIEGPSGKIHCDGDCTGSWPYDGEMFWCRDCIALTLERGCFDKVKGNRGLLFSVCERSHEFWVVPEREDLLAPGEVRVGEDKVVAFGEWVEGIRSVYLA
ncbi:hypothetical protein N8T08_002570 [Aspergillus melleus]|uniref:Uncharacterized protein n=1 Tax=Aspergillus melleus TaxID=138277 RepID=A0ACC3B8X5_9EURO|nr:hypothetical protein N8T08_002570 [Aspergillus melleus]